MSFSRLETEARDLMITRAEEYFNIQIRKNLGPNSNGTGHMSWPEGHDRVPSVWPLPSSFLPVESRHRKEVQLERTILKSVEEIRAEDPGIGGYKLWIMLCSLNNPDMVMPGRDSFYRLLRRNGLMLPPPKPRHTTNSNHRYRKWKNLIKGFTPLAANQLWVSDITYIVLSDGTVCYLHLITDAYSHKIIGWVLAESLRAAITMRALKQAIEQAVAMKGNESLKGLVHHSDRGIQYCCDAYVKMLQDHDISISMTEDYKPTDNAVAERINGIIKQSAFIVKATSITSTMPVM